jgi:hypothetical protein
MHSLEDSATFGLAGPDGCRETIIVNGRETALPVNAEVTVSLLADAPDPHGQAISQAAYPPWGRRCPDCRRQPKAHSGGRFRGRW